MAARKSFLYSGGADRISPIITSDAELEFDEADVWNSNEVVPPDHQAKKSIITHNSLPSKKPLKKSSCSSNQRPFMNAATSLPVNIPDWSRILGDDQSKNQRRESEDADDIDENEYDGLPPHEYLARTRGTSFSVHEGIGRVLKGRDLSRVRNAVWKQIGFED